MLALLKYLDEEDYSRIPKEKIDFLEKNKADDYEFVVDENLPLAEQEISEKANALLITIYRDHFASERQKRVLEEMLETNDMIIERKNYLEDRTAPFSAGTVEQTIDILERTNEMSLEYMLSLPDEEER